MCGAGVWHHNLPSAATGSVPVLPGTSPTSWYTTPENVQHIAYVGNDGLIHERCYFTSGDGVWHHNLPSAATGSVPVLPGTSPTSWYTTPENVQHIAYVGNDGLIHERCYFTSGDGVWHHNLPSAATGSVPVLPGTSPTSWYTTPENVQHIAYVGNDGLIHERCYFTSGDGVWHHNLPSAATGSVPVLPGTSPTSWYTTPENVQHIAYVGNDGLIHERCYFTSGDGVWHHNLPSAATGSVPVLPGTSPTSWYTTPENVQHIAYVGNDGLIHERCYFTSGDGVWHHNLPSAATGSVPVLPGTSPTSWYTTPENVQHIAYVGNDGLIHERCYFTSGDGVWHHNLPSAATGSVPVLPGTSPTSWYTTPENVQHIAYVGNDGLIHERCYFTSGDGAWHHNSPSAAEGSVPVRPGTSPTSWYTTPENVQHIGYVGTDGLIHELCSFIGGDGAWHHNLPSAAAGSVPVRPGTSPTSWYTTPENVQHIAYVGNDGLIHELFYRIGGSGGWVHNNDVPGAVAGAVPVMPGTSPTRGYTTPENVEHIAYVGIDQRIHELFFFIGGSGGWVHDNDVPGAVAGAVPVMP